MSFEDSDALREYIIANFMGPQMNVVKHAPIDEPLLATDMPKRFLPKIKSQPDIKQQDESDKSMDTILYLFDKELSREFHYNRDYSKQYKITLCLYKINDNSRTPFVEYFFIKKDSKYQFMQAELDKEPFAELNQELLQISSMESLEEPDETDKIDDEFLNQCSQLLLKLSNKLTEVENIELKLESMYNGFIEYEESNELFVFFDLTDFELDMTTSETEFAWAIFDEILNKRAITNIPIIESNIKLFRDYDVLTKLTFGDGSPLPIPIIGFMCKTVDEKYENQYYLETENATTTISITNPIIEHVVFGDVYMFSILPLEFTNLPKIKRYALFIDGAVHFLNKDISITDFVGDDKDFTEIDIVCFYKNENALYCVRQPDGFAEL
jgi:hypothetical protein